MNGKKIPPAISGGSVQLPNWWNKPFELPPLKRVPAGFDYIPEKNTAEWSAEQIASYRELRAHHRGLLAKLKARP